MHPTANVSEEVNCLLGTYRYNF